MSDYNLNDLSLELNLQEMEDMEVQEEELASAEDHLVLGSMDDQVILDLAQNRWPSQVSGDLLGASQLVDLSN